MPGVEIETVNLDADIQHPLDAVLAQVEPSKAGPVMVLGLERSNPSSAKERPILYALNMSRPDWAKELSRPLVFWVPEYLLGLMGREAPDFLDWRSDTLFFPESFDEGFIALESAVWLGDFGQSLPESQRRARMNELSVRLANQENSKDSVVLAARSRWLMELGSHFSRLGEPNAARERYLAAIEIERTLGGKKAIADLSANLGLIDLGLGKLAEAEQALEAALSMHEELGDEHDQVADLVNLSSLFLHAMRLEESEQLAWQAKRLAEQGNFHDLDLVIYNLLLGIALERQDLKSAREHAGVALESAKESGPLVGQAELLHNLGVLSASEGDYARAEANFKKALEMARILGDRSSVAELLINLAFLHRQSEREERARDLLLEAKGLLQQIGDTAGLEDIEARLRDLDTAVSPN